mgnify:CR=1 FL=1
MAAMTLSQDEIKESLAGLDDWKIGDKENSKLFPTDDFTHSMDLATRIGELADEQEHHPDILIQYDRVTVTLSTHSAGGVTEKDVELARGIEDLAT